jgi:hypothetical protein
LIEAVIVLLGLMAGKGCGRWSPEAGKIRLSFRMTRAVQTPYFRQYARSNLFNP